MTGPDADFIPPRYEPATTGPTGMPEVKHPAIPLRNLPTYDRDTLPESGWQAFRKKVTTEMVRVEGPFIVETREGPLMCEDGWLAVDSNGDPYPIAADAQSASYELA